MFAIVLPAAFNKGEVGSKSFGNPELACGKVVVAKLEGNRVSLPGVLDGDPFLVKMNHYGDRHHVRTSQNLKGERRKKK